jgi:hypothetical protein
MAFPLWGKSIEARLQGDGRIGFHDVIGRAVIRLRGDESKVNIPGGVGSLYGIPGRVRDDEIRE